MSRICRSCCQRERLSDLGDRFARLRVQPMPGEAQQVPVAAGDVVALAAVVPEALGVDVPRPAVHLDRHALRREGEVDPIRAEGVAEYPAVDAGLLEQAYEQPLRGGVGAVGGGHEETPGGGRPGSPHVAAEAAVE